MKYHPKNDASPEAATKFEEVAKAYQEIMDGEKNKDLDTFGFRSFFNEFQKEVESIFNPKWTNKTEKVEKKDNSKEVKTE